MQSTTVLGAGAPRRQVTRLAVPRERKSGVPACLVRPLLLLRVNVLFWRRGGGVCAAAPAACWEGQSATCTAKLRGWLGTLLPLPCTCKHTHVRMRHLQAAASRAPPGPQRGDAVLKGHT